MSLPLSPNQITLGQIGNFFSYTSNPRFLSQLYRGGTYVAAGATSTTGIPTSGTIRLSNFHGGQLIIKASPSWIAYLLSVKATATGSRSFLLTATMLERNYSGYGTKDGIVVAGYYEGGLQIYNSSNTLIKNYGEIGNTTAFIISYTVSGEIDWATRIGGNPNGGVFAQYISSITFSWWDSRLLLCGFFRSINTNGLTFYNANDTAYGTTITPTTTWDPDGFVAAYNQTGYVQWVAKIGGGNSEYPNNIYCVGSYGFYVTGISDSGVQVYNSNGTLFGSLTPLGGWDPYLIRYNLDGSVKWIARMGGSSSEGDTYSFSQFKYVGTNVGGRFTDIVLIAFSLKSNPTYVYNSDGNLKFTISGYDSGSLLVLYNGGDFFLDSSPDGVAQCVGYVTGIIYKVTSANSPSGGGYPQIFVGMYSGVFTAYNATSSGIGTAFGTTLSSTNNAIFLVSYNSPGNIPTSMTVGCVAQIVATTSITFIDSYSDSDLSNYVLVTGNFSGTLTAYNSNGSPFATTLTSTGTDCFVVCYLTSDSNTSLTVDWVLRINGQNGDIGVHSIAFDLGGDKINGFMIFGRTTTNPNTIEAFDTNGSASITKTVTSGTSVDSHSFAIRYTVN